MIFGLVAVAVLNPVSVNENAPDGHFPDVEQHA